MPTLYEDTNAHDLRELLSEVHQGASVLPEFQRDFVWDPSAVAELILSISNNFPAGSILRIRNSKKYFASRGFENAPVPQSHPTFLVLDGQQRMTSLYQAFFGVGPNRFFIDIGKLIAGEDLEEALSHCRPDQPLAKQLLPADPSNQAMVDAALAAQAERLILPLGSLRGSRDAFSRWKGQILTLRRGYLHDLRNPQPHRR